MFTYEHDGPRDGGVHQADLVGGAQVPVSQEDCRLGNWINRLLPHLEADGFEQAPSEVEFMGIEERRLEGELIAVAQAIAPQLEAIGALARRRFEGVDPGERSAKAKALFVRRWTAWSRGAEGL